MSKFEDSIFNVGDKVMLSPESQWVGSNSDQPDSANPTGVVGEITKEHVDAREDDTPFHWRVTWTNNTCNSYHSEDLILVEEKIVVTSPEDDLHQLIEELQCHVETLEQALEVGTKELIELREEQSVSTETPFKPIRDMTMEDWEQAKDEGWVFEMDGEKVFVQGILEEFKDSKHPIELGLLGTNLHHGTVTVEGHFYAHKADHYRNVTKRIK